MAAAPLAGAQVPAAISSITEADLRRDLFVLAGDPMQGREAGTIDEMRASIWVAGEMEKIGLQPVGDNGSWFQWWNMRRTRISTISSSVAIRGERVALWKDITPTTNTAAEVAGATRFISDVRDTSIDVRGRVVVAQLVPPANRRRFAAPPTHRTTTTRARRSAPSKASRVGAPSRSS